MGFFDSIKNALGGDDEKQEGMKGPSTVLKEAGIDPAGLDFKFGSDGTVTITGRVMDEARRERIAEVVGAIPQVTAVDNQITVGAPEPPPAPEEPRPAPEPQVESVPAAADADAAAPEASAETTEEPVSADEDAPVTSYTVQPGDSLWKIAEAHYGNGTKYQAIFEANRDILDNPDLIRPGQVLKLPRL
jgi:nucleoid-associated protein YgaU